MTNSRAVRAFKMATLHPQRSKQGLQIYLEEPSYGSAGDPAWLQFAVALGRHGFVQLAITLASILWTGFQIFKIRQNGTGKTLARRPAGSLVYESLSHLLRGTTLALSVVACGRFQRLLPNTIAMAYIFLLGLFRIITRGQHRPMLLHQIVAMTAVTLTLSIAADVLPLVIIGTSHRPDAVIIAYITTLFCSLLLSGMSPREWLPPRPGIDIPSHMVAEPSKIETCSWIDQHISYSRIDRLILKSARSTVVMSDMSSIPWHWNPVLLHRQFSNLRRQTTSTAQALLWLLWPKFLQCTVFGILAPAMELIGPFSLYQILEYLRNPGDAIFQPYVWLILMLVGLMLESILQQEYSVISRKISIYCKLTLTSEIFELAMNSRELEGNFLGEDKIEEADSSSEQVGEGTATGTLENLISTDINTIMNFRIVLMAIAEIPSAVLAIVGLYGIVGWPCFVGLGIIIIGLPTAGIMMRYVQKNEEKLKEFQDLRISLVSEYLRSIKVIKYFGWEDSIVGMIGKARESEQKQIWIVNILFVMFEEIATALPILSLLAIFSLYVGVEHLPMTASTAYPSVTLLNKIRSHFMFLSYISLELPKALVSLRRFDKFFASIRPLDRYPIGPLRIEQATFRRTPTADFRLYDINIAFVENGLNVVTGTSGSGKTMLLLAILGESVLETGKVTRPEDAAFASQTPWLQAASIRDNILFASAYDANRYETVVKACCLDIDLGELPNGDATDIGENGTTLSGGQRARVALARALYSFAPLLLLDDVFSALDTKTSTLVWNRVFCSDLIKNRTVVLVTQLSWIADEADMAIVVENGRIKSVDENRSYVRKPQQLPSNSAIETETASRNNQHANTNAAAQGAEEATENCSVDDEVATSGTLGGFPVLQYLTYYGGPIVLFLTMTVMVAQTGVQLLTQYWLSIWVDSVEDGTTNSTAYYLLILVALNFGAEILDGISFYAFLRGSWKAAQTLHQKAIEALFNVSLSWYTENPVGRVINRMSGDVETLDQEMLYPVFSTTRILIVCIMMLSAVTAILPIFIVPTLLLAAIGVFLSVVYNGAAVHFKQLVSASQSPILSKFSEGLNGMAIIRATKSLPTVFGEKLHSHLYLAAQANVSEIESDQWLKFRMNTLAATINVCAAVLALLESHRLSAGIVGFCLLQATEISYSILDLVFDVTELNQQMQTFHRVREYSRLMPEEEAEKEKPQDRVDEAVSADWPSCGSVEFRNVTVRYGEDGPDVLHNINLKFKAGERVAIVGRTGSGKSSLILSILRFTNIVSGQILYDGEDICCMPRKRLRQAVSMIPQESQLFQGTLAANLDPTGTIPDSKLQDALDLCQTVAAVGSSNRTSWPSGTSSEETSGEEDEENTNFARTLALTTTVRAKGENFSHGQRQVLSLCRVLARQSRLVLLDEATSNMDAETDAGIQRVLRGSGADEDGSGRCLITVAHRLGSIADYDTIVVMGSGKVLEVGSPSELMARRGSYYDMVLHDGDKDKGT